MIYSTYTIFSANRPISIIFGQNHAIILSDFFKLSISKMFILD